MGQNQTLSEETKVHKQVLKTCGKELLDMVSLLAHLDHQCTQT